MTPSYSGVIGRGWLARGGSYAVANIRGGGEYGPDGTGPRGGRTGSRCTRTSPRSPPTWSRGASRRRSDSASSGGSNGGLLMGVMLTRYPDCSGRSSPQCRCSTCAATPSCSPAASWIAEYGDPDDEADWAFLREYLAVPRRPAGQPYPPVLFITSTRDDRVHPGHARKMAALLRQHGYDVSYYENVEGGHGAAADNEQAATVSALTLDFLWRKLNPLPSSG